jgi:UDP-N-acetylmuramoylalanine--D-glutamate ligase
MGLGLHGGGIASARFFTLSGCRTTVTDLRGAEALRPSLERLAGLDLRYVLGGHREAEFTDTDLVIKNPAVPASSPFLRLARERGIPVETDLSVFLSLCPNPIVAVTGSKGKSTTSSAVHAGLLARWPGARLGGNITVSPLDFLSELGPRDPVVLELSSWQLADLRDRAVFRPRVSLITNLLPDHQDRYAGMEPYIADKKVIFRRQGARDYALFNRDDPFQAPFPAETRARARFFSARPLPAGEEGAWLEGERGLLRRGGSTVPILEEALLAGTHNRLNLLAAGLACVLFGMEAAEVRAALGRFPGLPHRLELVREKDGVRLYNDSAATMPHATAAALRSLPPPIVLITGGTDKNLDFSPLAEALRSPRAVFLLAGSATEKIRAILDQGGVAYRGPFESLEEIVARAFAECVPGTSLLFSPAAASFEKFKNEFDRGNRFRELALAL